MLKNLVLLKNAPKLLTNVVRSNVRNYSLYEPDYLAALRPKYPLYPCIDFQVTGYDFPVLESYQRFLHDVGESMDLEIANGWAVPGKKEEITKLKPNSSIVEVKYNLTTYERVVQITNIPAYQYPLLLRIAQAGLPEGVTLRVVEHDTMHDEIRYVPDTKMKELKDQLEDLGGARKTKKK